MDRNDFFAKSCNQNGIQKTVKEHLTEVAAKAKEYGDEIGWGTEAELCGMSFVRKLVSYSHRRDCTLLTVSASVFFMKTNQVNKSS